MKHHPLFWGVANRIEQRSAYYFSTSCRDLSNPAVKNDGFCFAFFHSMKNAFPRRLTFRLMADIIKIYGRPYQHRQAKMIKERKL